jgi:hypothetical protein
MSKETLERLTYAFSTTVFVLAAWYWVRQWESMRALLEMAYG